MYNDAASLPVIVDKARRVLSRLTDDYEIIIVNDGSTDGTAELAEEARSRHPCIKVVHHPRNLGYGAALRSGISASTKDWIFYTDGDGQYDVEELEALFALRRNADVVNGYKRGRADPWYRRALGRMYSFLVKRAFSLPVRDVDCDFRLMRGDLARSLDLHCDGGAICVELVKKLQLKGAVFREVAVSHYPRLDGNSKFFRPGNLVKMPLELVPLWCKLMAAGKEG
jgi:glycosyltransferase involved in cell wall biosynthesis